MFTDTKEECQQLCKCNSGCFYFTWVSDAYPVSSIRRRCFLKNQSIKQVTLNGVYSGPKSCSGSNKLLSNYHCQLRIFVQKT